MKRSRVSRVKSCADVKRDYCGVSMYNWAEIPVHVVWLMTKLDSSRFVGARPLAHDVHVASPVQILSLTQKKHSTVHRRTRI